MVDDAMQSERDFNERNVEEFRRNGGRVGGQFEGFPLLLLTSTGARSGPPSRRLCANYLAASAIPFIGSSSSGRPGLASIRSAPTGSSRSSNWLPNNSTADGLRVAK